MMRLFIFDYFLIKTIYLSNFHEISDFKYVQQLVGYQATNQKQNGGNCRCRDNFSV